LNGDYESNPLKIQVGANAGQYMEIYIGGVDSNHLGIGGLDIATRDNADAAIGALDQALKQVSGERARLGAYQNRLEHAYNNVLNTAENLTAAESRIRDADIAKEMMNYTKASILAMAAQHVLALHMQQAQSILMLLNGGKK
jgi:flagellin